MICEHLRPLEIDVVAAGIKEVYRGKPWTENCNEWVYYDCVFNNLEATMLRFNLRNDIIKVHSHSGTHDGQEHGLVCTACLDGIMGQHPDFVKKSFTTFTSFE